MIQETIARLLDREPLTRESLAATQERSLKLLAAANVSLAAALLVLRLT